jgi:phosphoribosyl 1,2-cyclic phosphate phosphodiesterase
MMNQVTLLGTGTSTGVPILGCSCSVCQSNDPRNKRLRTSAIIQTSQDKKILIDASPDLRTQLLRQQVHDLDGIIITHDHADHTHGMDDLRPFGYKKNASLPVFTTTETAQDLVQKFPYIFQSELVFQGKPILGGGIPKLHLEAVVSGKNSILEEEFEFFSLPHGHGETLGINHRKMAYLTDCREIPTATLETLRNKKLEILLIDCLRYAPHSTHLHLDLSLEYIEKINPARAVLIHLGHEIEYREILTRLRTRGIENVTPSYDGMSFYYS